MPDLPTTTTGRGLPPALRRFLATESAGGIVLVVAAVVALAWANSPWSASYASIWHDELVHKVVNDGLMSIFFFVVGLEIKRELVSGELRDRRTASLPAIAALGGMLVPAAIYYAVNAGHAGSRGWGVPMATDIAFAVGVVTLLGPRVPPALKLFLLALAIVDDIGAIVVIALFYGGGIHPAIVGVAVGLALPVRWGERIEGRLHPLSSFVIVPVFALANAGVAMRVERVDARVATGVVAGLVVGKIVGITGATWLAVRAGFASLPTGATWPMIAGIGAVAGMGFTVSLFVTDLAFERAALADSAALAVVAATAVAGVAGWVWLRYFGGADA